MNLIEKQSLRKKKSILYLVDKGEYSVGYALLKVEELYDNGKLIDNDYEELAEYLEELLEKIDEVVEEPVEEVPEEVSAENTAEEPITAEQSETEE